MGKSLAEYAAQNPQPEPPQERQAVAHAARSYNDQIAERDQVERLKASIAQQLQEGEAPQYILYSALRAIGLLTHDEAWAEAQQKTLDSVYSDLAQQSLLTDNAAIAAARLDAMQTEYKEKLRRQLQRQIGGYKRIARALNEALDAVNALDPPAAEAQQQGK